MGVHENKEKIIIKMKAFPPFLLFSSIIFILLFFLALGVNADNEDVGSPESMSIMSREEKSKLRKKSLEMFDHAYNAYMVYAYPADELMPLSCKGRYRGSEPSRGDVDDTLGNFTLTLIDTLDTLAVLGKLDEFDTAIRNVIAVTRFDADVVVSVFETNIRILGGLLGGHVAALYFKKRKKAMLWYNDELLTMAKEVGDRLLPAFNTTTGIPYARVNLRHGITPKIINSNRNTCTSCAGTMILEFAALSRLTGIAAYEEKSRKAMDYLWSQRHRSNNLMGTVLNVHNGDWIRRESGVGAGIDSYYEYVLKTYVLFGDDTYLARFRKHYDGVMRYISQGPLLVDVHMHKPLSAARNFMDALLAFWPGLQVLVGDIGPAVETHEMLYQVVKRHNFLPEAFTTDFRVHWGQHPLRPEFVESTYFLYKATGDPYYLFVGKKVLENLEEHARVDCGFAAIKDIKRGTHEDQMDSFVLAETFKYLYLLFSDKSELDIDVEDFVFTTEAHLLPLTLAVGNYSWSSIPASGKRTVRHDIYRFDKMSVAEMTKAADGDYTTLDNNQPDTGGDDDDDLHDGGGGVCRNYHVSVSEGPGYPHRLRHRMRDMVERAHPPSPYTTGPGGRTVPKLRASQFVAANREHLDMLRQMGIRIATMPDGRIQLLHSATEALSNAHAEAGLQFMQEMIELSKVAEQEGGESTKHEPMFVKLLSEPYLSQKIVYRAGPAQFGYDLTQRPPIAGELSVASPIKSCVEVDNPHLLRGRIAIVERGDCMFVEKARSLEKAGALGGIVIDQAHGSSSDTLSLFAMSGDGTNDVSIPMVFLFWQQGQDLLAMLSDRPGLSVELSANKGPLKEGQCSGVQVPKPIIAEMSPPPPSTTLSSSTSEPAVLEPEGPGTPSAWTQDKHTTTSTTSTTQQDFYQQEYHNIATRQYFLQVGTRALHLSIEVSPRDQHHTEHDCRKLKFEPLPDGSKMFYFFIKHYVRMTGGIGGNSEQNLDSSSAHELEGDLASESDTVNSNKLGESFSNAKLAKPNLNELYLDVVHSLQHNTNLGSLAGTGDYIKGIARFLEAAYFNLDRVDPIALEVMSEFGRLVNVRQKTDFSGIVTGGEEGEGVVAEDQNVDTSHGSDVQSQQIDSGKEGLGSVVENVHLDKQQSSTSSTIQQNSVHSSQRHDNNMVDDSSGSSSTTNTEDTQGSVHKTSSSSSISSSTDSSYLSPSSIPSSSILSSSPSSSSIKDTVENEHDSSNTKDEL